MKIKKENNDLKNEIVKLKSKANSSGQMSPSPAILGERNVIGQH